MMSITQSFSPPSSSDEVLQFVRALQARSADYNKVIPVRLNGHEVLALVDSGNTFWNAISSAVARTIGLECKSKYKGPPIGTAKNGESLAIVGLTDTVPMTFVDETGTGHNFSTRLVVVNHLSNGLNISLPFLVDNHIDQIHSQGILHCVPKNARFPMYKDKKHAKNTTDLKYLSHSVISISEVDIPVYSGHRVSIPPKTGKLLTAYINDNLSETPHISTIFSFNPHFLNKVEHLGKDQENLQLGLNSMDQAVVVDNKTVQLYFFNETDSPITISNNSLLGDIKLPEDHPAVISVNEIFSIEENPIEKSETNWMNNKESKKLTRPLLKKRVDYIQSVIGSKDNPTLLDFPNIEQQLVDLLLEFWNVFYREGNSGGTDIIEHPVYTPKGHPPIRLKNRPINPGLTDALQEQITTWLKDGVIRSGGVSPWNFPLLPVRKKNGKWRWVVDFRMLNSVTRKDSFPIPNIVELISYLRKSKFFTSLDLAQAFHSIPVREVDREKLSFCALDKFFQFCRMPFGLTSAPNTWARLVTKVLDEIPKTQLIVFFDDLLVHSANLDEHLSTLKRVMKLLQEAGLRLNMEKTDWIKTEVKFLGHIISDKGISVPSEFTQIIKDWPLPETLKQLRSFLGKCNYYRNHFKDFAIIADPLMAHLKGSTESSRKLNLEKDDAAVKSFENLKQLLMSPTLLAYPMFDKDEQPFIVDTDYSHEGIGAVLSQVQNGVERPISFNARRLKSSESQYASHKGELLALIFAIKTYEFFLTGRKFLVRTDNSALTWLKTQKEPKGILMRWLRILSTYDFDIIHRAGTKHGNADALSRTSHAPFLSEEEVRTVLNDDQIVTIGESLEDDAQENFELSDTSSDSDTSDLEEQSSKDPEIDIPEEFPVSHETDSISISDKQKTDPLISQVIKWVQNNHKPTGQEYKLLSSDAKFYADLFEFLEIDQQGTLIRKPIPFTQEREHRIALPESMHNEVMLSLHNRNHAGGNALASSMQLRYFFPRLVTTCRDFVTQCMRCQRLRAKTPQRHTYAHDLVGSPGEKICIDFVGPLKPTKRGHTSLLTIVDVFTRWFHAWPVKNQKAETVVKHLIRDYFPDRGIPLVVHSDNGPAFISEIFKNAMKHFDVRTTTTPVYNPKSNSVERFHRTLKRKFTALIHEYDQEWDDALPATLLAMRTTANRTTGYTPFFLEHGREARLPVDLIVGNPPDSSFSLPRYVSKLKDDISKAYETVAERQDSYIIRQREIFRERHHKINIDDLVWLYTDRPNPNLNRKFQSFWSGPYRVVLQLANTMYQLESFGRWSKEKIVIAAAVDRLKKCYMVDPDTNIGVPVELTAADVRPYFENQELVGRLPISDFAPHIFEKEEELPLALSPQPDNRDLIIPPTTDTEPAAIPEPASSKVVSQPATAHETLDTNDVPVDVSPSETIPPVSISEPEIPPVAKRRGRPKGSKKKVFPCTLCTPNVPCVKHCENCLKRKGCQVHTEAEACRQCTRTRRCYKHKTIFKLQKLAAVPPRVITKANSLEGPQIEEKPVSIRPSKPAKVQP